MQCIADVKQDQRSLQLFFHYFPLLCNLANRSIHELAIVIIDFSMLSQIVTHGFNCCRGLDDYCLQALQLFFNIDFIGARSGRHISGSEVAAMVVWEVLVISFT